MLIKKNEKTTGTYVNIKGGRLVIKVDGKQEEFDSIKGQIFDVDIFEDEFKGEKKEKIKIYLRSSESSYILIMDVESGYFRTLCNSLKSSKSNNEITITPQLLTKENGKPRASCFVEQDGKYLKHFFNKNYQGDEKYPEIEKCEFNGKVIYDLSKQTNYWKNWIIEKFKNPF